MRLDVPHLQVRFSHRGKDYKHKLVQDGGPFAIGKEDLYRFVVFETDCASEPLTSSNRDRQAIELKYLSYITMLEAGLYRSEWQIPGCLILFTTTTMTRLGNMGELLCSMTSDKRLLRCFKFALKPTILSSLPQPVNEDWAFLALG